MTFDFLLCWLGLHIMFLSARLGILYVHATTFDRDLFSMNLTTNLNCFGHTNIFISPSWRSLWFSFELDCEHPKGQQSEEEAGEFLVLWKGQMSVGHNFHGSKHSFNCAFNRMAMTVISAMMLHKRHSTFWRSINWPCCFTQGKIPNDLSQNLENNHNFFSTGNCSTFMISFGTLASTLQGLPARGVEKPCKCDFTSWNLMYFPVPGKGVTGWARRGAWRPWCHNLHLGKLHNRLLRPTHKTNRCQNHTYLIINYYHYSTDPSCKNQSICRTLVMQQSVACLFFLSV